LHRISTHLKKFGNVKTECFVKPFSAKPDIIFTKRDNNGNQYVCTVEVELNKTRYDETHIIKNLHFSNHIIIVCKTKAVQSEADKVVYDFSDEYKKKISSCLLSDFEAHFKKIFDAR